ncbi:MAG: ABC transporter permease [Solirubrobacteraceae bacterium]
MIGVILANLLRRRGRTLLTASGIAVGVATIVALLALTSGLERRAGELVHLGRADLGLFQRNAADLTTSVLPLDLVQRLKRRPEIADATPIQLLVEAIPGAPSAVVFGADPNGFLTRRAVITSGRGLVGGNDVLLGDGLARTLGLGPGATLRIARHDLRVVGIYHAGISFEDQGAAIALPLAQRLAGRRSNEVTTIAVALKPQVAAADAEASLRRALPSLQVIGSAEEAARVGANSVLISKAVPMLVALALIVGGLGVANTMVMAVLERRRETALLAAVGWSPRQIGGLVMGEAVIVSLVGACLGLVLGIAASEALVRTLSLLDFVSPHITAWALGRGLLVGVAIGLLGGLYPTWRASRMAPAGVLAQA